MERRSERRQEQYRHGSIRVASSNDLRVDYFLMQSELPSGATTPGTTHCHDIYIIIANQHINQINGEDYDAGERLETDRPVQTDARRRHAALLSRRDWSSEGRQR
ncbi:hypothetical protein LSAT2_010920 [Lamellibrachia satsuma]|nr:hypothetical protein LSAT2_010920 [Lamellibrachia satsuma]